MRSTRLLALFCLFFFATWAEAAPPATARVRVPLSPVFSQPDARSEQVTQVLMWDEVQVMETRKDWVRVFVLDQYRTDRGYPGWVRSSDLSQRPFPQASSRVAVSYPWVAVRSAPKTDAAIVAQAYLSTRLPLVGSSDELKAVGPAEWYQVHLPEGKTGWIRRSQVQAESMPGPEQGARIVTEAQKLEGTPYLWGGMSRVGIDCSGLVFVCYRMNGVTLPRDADQQFQVGTEVAPSELTSGDLVFFGESDDDITHVGIYAGEGKFVHASSGSGVVVSELFQGWYKQMYRGARRILQRQGGGTQVLTPSP